MNEEKKKNWLRVLRVQGLVGLQLGVAQHVAQVGGRVVAVRWRCPPLDDLPQRVAAVARDVHFQPVAGKINIHLVCGIVLDILIPIPAA